MTSDFHFQDQIHQLHRQDSFEVLSEFLPTGALSISDTQDMRANSPLKPGTLTLSTQDQFIWKSRSFLFVLPFDQIEDHLLASSHEAQSLEGQHLISWNAQAIPLYRLSQLFGFDDAGAMTPIRLIVKLSNQTIAIESKADDLVTAETLSIQSLGQEAPYLLGTTPSQGHPPSQVIDLVQYLEQQLVPQPAPSIQPVQNWDMSSKDSSPLVMIVDDSKTVREILTQELQNAGYQVCQAYNGQDALEKLGVTPNVRLVICDLDMPTANGFDFLDEYRKTSRSSQVPVVILSHGVSDRHKEQIKQLGAQSILTKTSVDQRFIRRIQTIVAQGGA